MILILNALFSDQAMNNCCLQASFQLANKENAILFSEI